MHLTLAEFVAVLVATVIGATVQGTIGFGINLIVVPVLALVEPAALPASTIFLAIPLTLGMVLREHAHVDWHGVGWMSCGRVPGSIIGAAMVSAIAVDSLSVMIGAFVIVAVVLSWITPPIPITPWSTTSVGLASVVMGTASSIGGPPVALLYQHHSGPVLRSTQAAQFAIGTAISLIALGAAGEVSGWQAVLALALTPAVLAGLLLSRPLHRWLDSRWLRPAVLTFAATAGAFAIVRALV